MANELATKQNTAVNPYEDAANDMSGSDGAFLKFNGKEGEFTYGQDEDTLLDEAMVDDGVIVEVAVNMAEFKRGYMCWIDDDVKDEKLRLVTAGAAIREEDLPDYTDDYVDEDEDGWVECAEVPLRDISDGEQYLFKTSSKGALRALKKLLKAYGKVFMKHDMDEETPIIILGMDSYMHKTKKFGKIYNPIFKLDRFVDTDTLNASVDDDDSGYEPEEEEEEPEVAEEEVKKETKKAKRKSRKY